MGRPKSYLSKEREEALRQFWYLVPRLPLRALAAEWGCSVGFISTAANRMGLPSRQIRSKLRRDAALRRFEPVIASRKYLEQQAGRRGITLRELEALLLQVIANDRMVNAVLDDRLDDADAAKQEPECHHNSI